MGLTDVNFDYFDNGTSWPEYVSRYTGVTLYPFAVGGATCSSKLTFHANFPYDVLGGQLGAYYNLVANGSIVLNPEETVYSLWIGE